MLSGLLDKIKGVDAYMNWQTIRKANRTLVVIGMVLTMVLSVASVATAAISKTATSNTLTLNPSGVEPDATGQFNYDIEVRADGSTALTNWGIEGSVATDEDVNVWLVTGDGNGNAVGMVKLGTLKADGTDVEGQPMPVENFQDAVGIVVTRTSDQEPLLDADFP